MSSAYAERYRILPVAITTREVTVAAHLRAARARMEEQIRQVLRLEIKRVIASPLDIQSYLVEVDNLARSIKGATTKDKGDVYRHRQLRAAGAAGMQRELMPTTSTSSNICDGFFNYAFQERDDIHLEPRREVSTRFRIHGDAPGGTRCSRERQHATRRETSPHCSCFIDIAERRTMAGFLLRFRLCPGASATACVTRVTFGRWPR